VDALLKISRAIDSMNTQLGKKVAWLILLAVIVATVNAIIRKVFNMSSNAWLELQWVLFGAVFLICASWTLLAKEHIRIDIVNSMFPRSVRRWIDLLGHLLFLMPFCIIMIVHGWPFFTRSYAVNEQSLSAGGLAQWPAKLLVPLGFTLLLAQGISEAIKMVGIMVGKLDDDDTIAGHAAAAEAEAERLLAQAKADGFLT
jgi:TRAP-type mannitol/chloroaromatic compound transport system permease small subunit